MMMMCVRVCVCVTKHTQKEQFVLTMQKREVASFLHTEAELHFQEMEVQEKEELEQVAWRLNAKLEEEIRALRKQTEWTLSIEESQIRSKYAAVRQEQHQVW